MTRVPAEATPERLTAVLRRAGVLARSEVVDVAVETSRDTLISRIARLRLTYGSAADAGPSARTSAVTAAPFAASARARWPPVKPVAPVTKARTVRRRL